MGRNSKKILLPVIFPSASKLCLLQLWMTMCETFFSSVEWAISSAFVVMSYSTDRNHTNTKTSEPGCIAKPTIPGTTSMKIFTSVDVKRKF